jgi:hypothetical protein
MSTGKGKGASHGAVPFYQLTMRSIDRLLTGVLDVRCDSFAPGDAPFDLLISTSGIGAYFGPDEDTAGLRPASFRELLIELAALQLELIGLDPQEPGLLLRDLLLVLDLLLNRSDLAGLLAISEECKDGRDDREEGQDRGGDGGDLA